MSKSNHERTSARAQRRATHTMSNTKPSIIRTIVALVGQHPQQPLSPPDPVREAAQLACARWLAGFCAFQKLYVGQLVERTDIRVEHLLALNLGMARPDMLTPPQEAALREALTAGQEEDQRTLNLLLDLALGRNLPPEPSMLVWVLDDLEQNVWRQADVESMFAEHFAPADTREIEEVHKVLTHVQLLLLQILFLGPKSSQELHDEAIRRRVWGKAGLDSASFAAVVDFLIARGLVELIDDRWHNDVQLPLLHFQLTSLGIRVVALQRYIEQTRGQVLIFARLREWLHERQRQRLPVDTTATG